MAGGLAQQAEAACGAELHEIYGSTESSALASGAVFDLDMPARHLRFAGDVASAERHVGDCAAGRPDLRTTAGA